MLQLTDRTDALKSAQGPATKTHCGTPEDREELRPVGGDSLDPRQTAAGAPPLGLLEAESHPELDRPCERVVVVVREAGIARPDGDARCQVRDNPEPGDQDRAAVPVIPISVLLVADEDQDGFLGILVQDTAVVVGMANLAEAVPHLVPLKPHPRAHVDREPVLPWHPHERGTEGGVPPQSHVIVHGLGVPLVERAAVAVCVQLD